MPVGSGPYRIERFEPGRFIVYQRDENYWGKDLAVNRGMHNIDRLRYDYYRDVTVALEAFKAGSYDLRVENVAKQWATGDFPALAKGLVKKPSPTKCRPGCRALSTICGDPCSRIPRSAKRGLRLRFRMEQSEPVPRPVQANPQLFRQLRTGGAGFAVAGGIGGAGTVAQELPPEVFSAVYEPPTANDDAQLRANFQKALQLLQEAGWVFRDHQVGQRQTGEPFRFELLIDDPTWERIGLPFARNLERLGIEMGVRTVDSAQYETGCAISISTWWSTFGASRYRPATSSASSGAAPPPVSRVVTNLAGLKSPAVDALVDQVIAARTAPVW